MMLNCLILLLIVPPSIYCITCQESMELPKNYSLTLLELKTMKPEEMINCISRLGRIPLRRLEADYIWQTLIDYYDGVPNIPQMILAQLHWITTAIRPEDYANITIDTIEVVSNFGFNYGFDSTQLEMIVDKVRTDFAGKTPEDYTYYDLTALNRILCAFNKSEIERIHPSAYREAAFFIGKLQDCSSEVMRGFATLAVHKDAFGVSDKWTGLVVKTVGIVAEFLPEGITKELENRKRNDKEKIIEPIDLGDEYRAKI